MIGSIVIRNNPVTARERYLMTVVPHDHRHVTEAWFEAYEPQDRVEGGYWTLKFKLYARENILKEMFEQGLGREVEAWGYGLQLDFEGQLYGMRYHLPPDVYEITQESIVNKLHMRADYDADGAAERGTELTNTDSDAQFGTKQQVISGGELEGLGVADQTAQQFIDLRGWPRPSSDLGAGRGRSGAEYIEMFVRGFAHSLSDQVYNQTAVSGTQGMSSQIEDVLDAIGEFVRAYLVSANATTVTKEYDADQRGWDIIRNMLRLGDAQNQRWVGYMMGKTVTRPQGRLFIAEQAAPAVVPGT